MDERSMRVLEFHKVKQMLESCASCELGRERCRELAPLRQLPLVEELQAGTTEARRLVDLGKQIPYGGVHDIGEHVDRAVRGATLQAEQLLDVLYTLEASRRLRKVLTELGEGFPVMTDTAMGIEPLPKLEQLISGAISESAEVMDSASSELRSARVKIRALNNKIRDTLDSIVRSQQWSKILQDPVVSLRNGRFVVPVRSEMRSQAPGIVHDQSSSGATLFIEPMAVVELNNQLRQAVAVEEAEIERILLELSNAVGDQAEKIERTLQALGAIDFIMARGRLSSQMEASAPELNVEGRIELFGARHPLLRGDVVPIDPYLGKGFTTLVITGPNTGGKTVTLKTIGLLTLMGQAGLHISAEPGSELCLFEQVFADIGDEQSIEQSLSTFSSHLTHITSILRATDSRTLVLLDELGAGTDPQEGAALAMAILEELHSRGARTVATTHYSELKVFAHTTPGLRNASVEFDVETLRPTYRLSIGVPGASNAFAIAQRLGLVPAVLDRARSLVGAGGQRMEQMISTLQDEHERAATARSDAEALRRRYLELKDKYEALTRQAQADRATALKRARDEADILLREARQEAESLVERLRAAIREASEEGAERAKADEEIRNARRGLEDLRGAVRELTVFEGIGAQADADAEADGSGPEAAGEMGPGATVELLSLGQRGTILDQVSSDEFVVSVGSMRINVNRSGLRMVASKEADGGRPDALSRRDPTAARLSSFEIDRSRNIQPELDLRGMRVEEALDAVDKYLDDAVLSSIPVARIIHGKGTGALREAVRNQMASDRRVASMRWGEAGEGGDGVTVVSFHRD